MSLRPIIFGLLGTAILLSFYFAILTVISGWSFAWFQFAKNWYWIVSLTVGFGAQVGLFVYARAKHRADVSGKVAAVSGGASGTAMVSCCAHYLVNILPIVGVSGFAALIGQYQTELFVVGLISNLLGIGYMFNKSQLLQIKFN